MNNRRGQFQSRMQNGMMQFMYGRNGFDNLARFCYFVSLIMLVINLFANNVVIYFAWVAFFAYAMFRTFSKNVPKRYAENQKYLSKTAPIRKRVNLLMMQFRDRKTARYYICSNCHQQIRVPRGKGRIEITCPKCRQKFIKKT